MSSSSFSSPHLENSARGKAEGPSARPASADASRGGPQYARVRHRLLALVSAGQPGDALPAERMLCREIGVSRATLRRVIEHLVSDGVLEVQHGSGTFIKNATVPDRKASDAGSRQNKLVALLVPSVEFPMISSITKGVEARATELGYHTMLSHDHGNPAVQIEQLRRIVGMHDSLSGIIVYPDSANFLNPGFLALIKEARRLQMEVVFVDRYADIPGVSCVLSDNFKSMYRATEHVIMSGRRRIGFLTFSEEGGVSYHDRRKGFYQAVADYRLKPEWVVEEIVPPGKYEHLTEKIIERWIAEDKFLRIDALVCMIGNMAFGAWMALKKAGIRVPEDVALVGYDDYDYRGFPGVDLDLTHVEQPGEKIGAESVDLLLRKVLGGETMGRHVLVETNFVLGTSSGTMAVR